MVSTAVLLGALTVALTSTSFEIADGRETQAAGSWCSGAQLCVPAAGAAAHALPASPDASATASSQTRTVVYFIVDSVEQIGVLKDTLRGDTVYLVQQGLPPMPPAEIHYLLFDTPEAESFGARFLMDTVESAPREGYTVQIVDLTR
jgi:hypothetical protein